MTQIDKIKAEIKRRIEKYKKMLSAWSVPELRGNLCECKELLAIIESLEKEPKVGLEREIIRYKVPFSDEKECLNETTLNAIAYHFYDLGCRHTAAEADDIEFERQQREERAPKIHGWVARDEDGTLVLGRKKPERIKSSGTWTKFGQCMKLLDEGLFPNLKFTDEPIEIELTMSQVIK